MLGRTRISISPADARIDDRVEDIDPPGVAD
jgi:hypothetical protein